MSVRIVTDSSSVIPRPIREDLSITTVPMWLHLGETSYRDGVDMEADEFYERLAAGERVSTSSPSPGDFVAAFERVLETDADAILVPTVARGFSAIHDAARVAAQEVAPARVIVLDTGTAVSGAGLIAIAAARAAAGGAPLSRVVKRARKVAGSVQLLATLRTLQYLRRSGRVPAARAWAGDLLRVKPVIRLEDGEVVREPVSFTHEGALNRITEGVIGERRRSRRGGGELHAGVFHAGAPDDAGVLERRIRQERPDVDLFVTTFSPAMGAHTGPGVVGVAWWWE
jgi:DegV family protein with EDD domain